MRPAETRKFVAGKRSGADGKSMRCSIAAARNTPRIPVFGIPLRDASSRPVDSSIGRRTSVVQSRTLGGAPASIGSSNTSSGITMPWQSRGRFPISWIGTS